MKVLRIKEGIYYKPFVREYCCDDMRNMRGTFAFGYNGRYYLTSYEGGVRQQEARFCPFCGEKIEIEIQEGGICGS